VDKGNIKPQDVLEALNAQQHARGQSAVDSTIRVDVGLLDQLMNRVGELVLLRNQILQFTNSSDEAGLLATSQRLNLLTTKLQEGVMKTRMQPIGNIWKVSAHGTGRGSGMRQAGTHRDGRQGN
jgi:two-component system chemotaxis sensor kinase CheA